MLQFLQIVVFLIGLGQLIKLLSFFLEQSLQFISSDIIAFTQIHRKLIDIT
jgi:hypothetical protein